VTVAAQGDSARALNQSRTLAVEDRVRVSGKCSVAVPPDAAVFHQLPPGASARSSIFITVAIDGGRCFCADHETPKRRSGLDLGQLPAQCLADPRQVRAKRRRGGPSSGAIEIEPVCSRTHSRAVDGMPRWRAEKRRRARVEGETRAAIGDERNRPARAKNSFGGLVGPRESRLLNQRAAGC